MGEDAQQLPAKSVNAGLVGAAVVSLGVHSPGLAAAVTALAPVTEWMLVRAVDRNVQLLGTVLQSTNRSAVDLGQRLRDSWHAEQLVLDAADAAQRTADRAKVHQLAMAVARGVFDDAFVDTASQLVAAIRDLDSVHVNVLTTMAEDEPPDRGNRREGAWTREQLARRHPEIGESVLPAVIARLIATGCISDTVGVYADYGVGVWAATPFARALVAHLRDNVQPPGDERAPG